MPRVDWKDGKVDWREGEEGDEQSRLFGADPVFIDEDVLAAVVKGLNRQSAAGTSCVNNTSRRRVFRQSNTGGMKLLLWFARVSTARRECERSPCWTH
jgi:hypothetical protein